MPNGYRRRAAIARPHPHYHHPTILVVQNPMNGNAGKASGVAVRTLDESCRWEQLGARLLCTTHQQLGQRMGLGKLYEVQTSDGSRLVRAPDGVEAMRAVSGLRVQRALPHEADGRHDVVDTRPIVHRRPVKTVGTKPARRPWAEPKPVQFTDLMPECAASGWETDLEPRRPSAWERLTQMIFSANPGRPRAR